MIRVTVELVPFGDEEKSTKIGELVLANVQQRMFGLCSYDAVYTDDSEDTEDLVYKQGVSHTRKDGFWKLLQRIIEQERVPDLNDVKLSTESLATRLG